MEKQSVGFVIDNTVLNSHVGVRRYLLSMAQALCREFNVRLFNVEYEPINNKPFFTELYVDNQFAKDNGFSINHIVGQNKNEILKKLPSVFFNRNSKKKGQDNIYACSYGAYFPEDLDTIIVAAPWVMKGELDLKAKKGVYCIAYDAIPNDYSISAPEDKGLQAFAYQHIFAYKTFLAKYNGLLAISNETAKQLVCMFPNYKSKVNTVPVFLPAGFEDVAQSKINGRKQERVVLLASPFDLRKGLKLLPDFINNLIFDKLIIFGAPRCSLQDINDFFNKISMNEITWWSEVDFKKQIELFESANVLIFPSLNEGLGLPVLESYSCGTPVYVSNTSPLNELVDKYFVISSNFEYTCQAIQSTIDSATDYDKFKSIAIEKWGSHHLIHFIKRLGS